MKHGYLSQYFEGVAAKILSSVEVDPETSNQHEFNGTKKMRDILGEPDSKVRYEAKFLYLTDDNEPVTENGFLTWYDTRKNDQNRSCEYRLYFLSPIKHALQQCANAGDILVIAKRPDNTLLAIVAESETTIAQQILWLFSFSGLSDRKFSVREELETGQDRIEFASRLILESIGIYTDIQEEFFLDEILFKFDGKFPDTRQFSDYARSTLSDVTSHDGHDAALMTWMEREEILFRTLEGHIIGKRLSQGFSGDINGFISFSLSVQNRRKSRAGHALEHHLEALFQECGVRYDRNLKTENKSRPDFIFPGKDEYHDPVFDALNLTMLGVKRSCKDRWRQVLTEADRIDRKHLLTLESAISENQTDEMKSRHLQLVLPKELYETYSPRQQSWLMSVSEFTSHVLEKQKQAIS